MQLLKIQCTSCGSPMEVSPGINRVRCPSCGMTYLIDKGNSRKDPGFVEDASGDNPVEVLLVPLSNNTLPMHTYDYKGAANTGSTDNPCLYPEAGNWDFLEKALLRQLDFVACLAYVSDEAYTIDMGSFAINRVWMYYNPVSVPPYLTSLTPGQTQELVEPPKAYSHYGNWTSRLKKKGARTPYYDAAKNAESNAASLKSLERLIRKYHIEYVDEVRYTPLESEHYYKKRLFGGYRDIYRYWTTRYTSRRMYARFSPEDARPFLSDQMLSDIQRMKNVRCIEDIAAIIYREFSKEGGLDLNTHGYMNLEIKDSQIVVKNIRYIDLPGDRGRHWKGDEWVYITYSHYGMQSLNRQEHVNILASLLIRRLNELTAANNDTDWNLTHWYTTSGSDSKVGLDLQFMPSVKAVGVYKSWV